MSLLFGLGGGRRGRIYIAARLALIVAFLVVLLAFHPKGTTLVILQVVRVVLLLAIIAPAWIARRRRIGARSGNSE